MKIAFVSNYISHHQIPFCEAMYERLGEDYAFVELMPMEEERRKMGWEEAKPAYVRRLYAEEAQGLQDGPVRQLIRDCDILLFRGMDREELVYERLLINRPVIRISESIYKDGRWRAVSPRGLIHKYQEFTRWRKAPAYLLCAGAYVAGDFELIGAFPGRKYTWGYFPPLVQYESEEELFGRKHPEEPGAVRILWTGRFVDFKHIEMMAELIRMVRERYVPEHPEQKVCFEIIGSGAEEEALRSEFGDSVEFTGFLPADQVRPHMERADLLVFTSDRGEGWGAVVNEAMNSGCAVVASHAAGAVRSLIRDDINGRIYTFGDREDLYRKVTELLTDSERIRQLGAAAYRTILEEWNAQEAADRLLALCACILENRPFDAPAEGPMSRAVSDRKCSG